MTDPSQYFKGRTVQEQMNEVIGYVDTRAAEVATTAIASDVAQVHQDMLDADAGASAAAASAAAAAGTLANAVKKTGEASQSIAGDIAVAGDLSAGEDLTVTGDAGVQGQLSVLGGCDLRAPVTVPTPSNNTDAATKKYVDDADALKISIADINSYAVGLTGNQGPIAGAKSFSSRLNAATGGIKGTHFASDHSGWCKVCKLPDNNRAYILDLISCTNNIKYTYARIFVTVYAIRNVTAKYVWKISSETVNLCVTKNSADEVEVWFNGITTGVDFMLIAVAGYGEYQTDLNSKPVFYTDSGSYDLAVKPAAPDYTVTDVS